MYMYVYVCMYIYKQYIHIYILYIYIIYIYINKPRSSLGRDIQNKWPRSWCRSRTDDLQF